MKIALLAGCTAALVAGCGVQGPLSVVEEIEREEYARTAMAQSEETCRSRRQTAHEFLHDKPPRVSRDFLAATRGKPLQNMTYDHCLVYMSKYYRARNTPNEGWLAKAVWWDCWWDFSNGCTSRRQAWGSGLDTTVITGPGGPTTIFGGGAVQPVIVVPAGRR